MGQGSLKKTYAKNKSFMRNALIATGVALYLGIVVVWGYDDMHLGSWTLLALYLGLNGYILSALRSMGKATFENGKLVDIRMGLIEYHWDILYITWVVMVLSIYTSWALLIYLIIPAYALYLFNPFAKQEGDDDDSAAKGRRERRAEKRGKVPQKMQRVGGK